MNKAVIHIDLQHPFLDAHTLSAFQGAKRMSEMARATNLTNIWIACALRNTPATTFKEAKRSRLFYDLEMEVVEPQEDELFFGKTQANAFLNMHLCAHIQEHEYDELFITGVWANACVKSSIIGAFSQAAAWKPFPRISIVQDAVDIMSNPDYDDTMSSIRSMRRHKSPEHYLKMFNHSHPIKSRPRKNLGLISTEEFANHYGLN
ncbi:MAG: isochorismatase family protein [Pseudomonadota bacterium]|nr:isochorismatase family protein [Pseudomonadota bacterium]